uniref:Reverse transcriptase domain-containing protein n=1 Tax=Glossina austeni TaxID=7395 RepID=A0A1A9UHZ6_GLOAU
MLAHKVPQFVQTSEYPAVTILKARIVNNLDDFRPISILPAIFKFVEHIIKDQIVVATTAHIYKPQYAFRQWYSAASRLLCVTDSVRADNNIISSNALLSLHLSKALNSLHHSSYLRDRSQFQRCQEIGLGPVFLMRSGVPLVLFEKFRFLHCAEILNSLYLGSINGVLSDRLWQV